MKIHTTMLRRAGVAAVAGLMAILTVPVGATGAPAPTHESYTFSGMMADATWFDEDFDELNPEVGVPRVLAVMGADATAVYRVQGVKPERMPQPAFVAMALMMPGVEPGDEPYQAELWCVSEEFSFTIARDLSTAALEIPTCEAMVVVYDEETGEEMPNGVTVTLSATATWTATGPLENVKSHSRYTYGDSWTMDRTKASMRPAEAHITVTGLPGGLFDETAQEGAIQDVRSASLLHM
ncbi:hypothetical protein GA707_17300 [Nostocoides sp. F2B08]|uniref:hypothetical protein n=1 Tax=Nostocoides sp. F2B08 TaxID=2653936 RepID=UPI0012639332|nr:hypothetical protein [Tetrasphaera sp. F2B08]KAB7741950.1 hypothetical protein GA707_17300 [Tetrasphaera sp. F2B08]